MRNYGPVIPMKLVKLLKKSRIKQLNKLGKKLESEVKKEFEGYEIPKTFNLEVVGAQFCEVYDLND